MYYMCVHGSMLHESVKGREGEGGGGCCSVHTCRSLPHSDIVYIGPLDTCLDILVRLCVCVCVFMCVCVLKHAINIF